MSRQLPQDELNKKRSYRFKQWMSGEVDQYVGILEMKRQEEAGVSETEIRRHKRDQEKLFADIYDKEHNWVYRAFLRFYKLAAIVSCVAMIVVLVVTVSFLPPVGDPSNPAHNEVVDKYIEDGMQDTGAVNIVAGPMALPAARILKKRFGTPYFNLADPADAESLTEEELQKDPVLCWNIRAHQYSANNI